MTKAGRILLGVVMVAGVFGSMALPTAADDADVKALVDGVSVIDAGGLPGPVCAFGEKAFAAVTGDAGRGARLPLVVATRFGEGRVVAFGKYEFLSPFALDMGDTAQMMINAARWASGKEGDIAVGVHEVEGLAAALTGRGFAARDVDLDGWQALDVLLVAPDRVREEDLKTLSEFVAGGKGIVVGALGWGWQQLNPAKTLAKDNFTNRLLAPMGIVYPDGTLGRTSKDGYAVGEIPSPLTNASTALDAALAQAKGERELTPEEAKQITAVLSRLAPVLPPGDTILLPRLQELMADPALSVVPTVENPLKSDDALARVVLTMQIREANELPAEEVRAHPAGLEYPGAAPEDAERVTRTVDIDTSIPRWHSTGLYAAPGELIKVVVPEDVAAQGLKVRIGSTTCRNWHRSNWLRAPEITREYALLTPTTEAANAFGGLVYITVPGECDLGAAPVTISGAVEAPYFVLGETSLEDWKETIRNHPAPRAELASNKTILTVPSEVIRELDDPDWLMHVWDRVQDLCADLAAFPSHDRAVPQRYCADAQICAGYMHAGNPIMLPTSAAADLVNAAHLVHHGDWGLYHETGHMHQHRDWTFGGTVEVTVNLFTLYVYDKLCGIPVGESRMAKDRTLNSTIKHLEGGSDFGKWKGSPFLGLVMYVQLQEAFGWDAYKAVFAEYRDLPDDSRAKSDDERRDQWMVRFSRHVGRNLGPFFEQWGVPTSQEARDSIEDLPEWMPEDFPPNDPVANRAANEATVIYTDSAEADSGGAGHVVDGFANTIWHTRWSGADVPGYPHEIVVDLGDQMRIAGVTVLPRQTGANGWIAGYEVYVSEDGERWGGPAATGGFDKNKDLKRVLFGDAVSCRYIRFVALKGFDDQVWASMAELDVIPVD